MMTTATSTEHTGLGSASFKDPAQRPFVGSCKVLGCRCMQTQVWDNQVLPMFAQHAICVHSAGAFHHRCCVFHACCNAKEVCAHHVCPSHLVLYPIAATMSLMSSRVVVATGVFKCERPTSGHIPALCSQFGKAE